MDNGPQLLVARDPAWHSFATSVCAVLTRSPYRVRNYPAVEAGVRLRSPAGSILLHGIILLALIRFLPALPLLRGIDPPPQLTFPHTGEVIYYLGPQLPAVPDVEGSPAGPADRVERPATQTRLSSPQAIRIARGEKWVEKVVEAPSLKLPPVEQRVSNLLVLGQTLPAMPVDASPRQPDVTPSSPDLFNVVPAPDFFTVPANSIAPPPVATVENPKLVLAAESTSPPPISANPAGEAVGGANTNSPAAGLVISTLPGERVGLPEAGTGSLDLADHDIDRAAVRIEGSGAGPNRTATGSTIEAHLGNSPSRGPGGAGGNATRPALPGVSIQGGSLYIPSFSGQPGVAHKNEQGQAPAIVIISTPRAGGLLDSTAEAQGARVYTSYFETSFGTVVLQLSDPAPATGFAADLTVPEALHTDLPAGLITGYTVVACTVNRLGTLDNVRVVRTGDSSRTPKLLAALQSWKFKPALRNHEPLEVRAALAFATRTR